MALITIGIPVYNEEAFLAKTIESAIHQTFRDIRIIISDNCSSDRSYEIANYYAQQDSRIELIRQPENIGPTKNFLYSLDKADSKYFVWLGGHDIFCEQYIEEAIALLEQNPDVVMAYPKAMMIDAQDQIIGHADSDIDSTGRSITERLLKVAKNLFYCTSFHGVFRTDILKQLPFETAIASDHLVLFMAATYGQIQMIESIGIQRRQPRTETYEETKQRWTNWGVYQDHNQINPYATTTLKHIEYLWRRDAISIAEKLTISLGIKDIFTQRFGVTWTDLLSESYRVSTTIPGLIEALILESFSDDESLTLQDYILCTSASELSDVIDTCDRSLQQQRIRLIHLSLPSAEQINPLNTLTPAFEQIAQQGYQWFAVESGACHAVSQPQPHCRNHIALPAASQQTAKAITFLKAQLLTNQIEVQRLYAQLAQSQPQAQSPQAQSPQAHINEQLQAKIDRLQIKLTETRDKLERSQSKLRQTNAVLHSIERSKLWTLRRGWLRLKRVIGIKGKG